MLFRLGRWRKIYTQPKRVIFRPSPEFGSSHFEEARFKQYRPQYSASPGGDIIPISENPIRVLACLCGYPILPGRRLSTGKQDFKSFQKSFAAEQQYRESTSPEAILRGMGHGGVRAWNAATTSSTSRM